MSSATVRVALVAVSLVVLSACTGGWQGPVPIDPSHWDITIETCGEIEGFEIKWGEGFVTNTTTERSPFYDIEYTVTYTDGYLATGQANEIIEPIAPGGRGDFSFALEGGRGRDVATCEMIITDSVQNYTG